VFAEAEDFLARRDVEWPITPGSIGVITTFGRTSFIHAPKRISNIYRIAVERDGNMWFTGKFSCGTHFEIDHRTPPNLHARESG
jgi:hypothetical protein